MSKKYPLEDRVVQLFLSGPHEFAGRVEHIDDDKIVLKSEMGSLVIYRKHIIAAMILDEKSSRDSIDRMSTRTYDNSMSSPTSTTADGIGAYIEDEFQENHYGSVIPSDMLIGEDEGPQLSFSLNMSDLKDPKIRGDKYGSTEENGLNRKED